MALDVGTVFHNQQFLRFCISFLGYGYYGDCILDSEQNRWMGPKRYDWEGKSAFFPYFVLTASNSLLVVYDTVNC